MEFKDKAIVVCFKPQQGQDWGEEDNVQEITCLARTAWVDVLSSYIVPLKRIVSSTYIGSGKAQDIAKHVLLHKANVVIFDTLLSPAQVKNLQKIIQVKIIDRAQLILDIFARRARTNEAKIQVELAQLQYLLPLLFKIVLDYQKHTAKFFLIEINKEYTNALLKSSNFVNARLPLRLLYRPQTRMPVHSDPDTEIHEQGLRSTS